MISFKALDANGELINSKMKPFTYPAGEVSLKFSDSLSLQKNEIAIIQPDRESLHTDIFQYMIWEKYISGKGSTTTLVIPYVPGAREDRGEVFGLEEYVRNITQYLIGNIVIFDPHSNVTKERLDWHTEAFFADEEPTKVHIMTTADLVRQRPWAFEGYDYVIAPDEGATERAQSVADVLGVPVVQVKKARDFDTGKITGLIAPEIDDTKKYLVVDDLCDGGRTFTLLSDNLGLPKEQIDLYVSHGVFSKGTAELEKKFGRIITTNSYLSEAVLDGVLRKNGVEVLDVIHPMIDLIK